MVGLKKGQTNSGSFRRGNKPWNKGTKGIMNAWNKGKKCPQISKGLTGKKLSEGHRKKVIKNLRIPIEGIRQKGQFKEGNVPWNWGKPRSEETKRKIREKLKGQIPWMKGRHHSEESKKKNKIAHLGKKQSKETILKRIKKGEEHYNWQGGKSFEPYDRTFNNKFKRAIRKRDNQICMLCGIHREKLKRVLDVHHVNYNKLLSIPENCISLCNSCHVKTNFNRKHWTKFFQNLLAEKYGYEYQDNKIVLEVKNE
ncbi:MAG: NUMOD3 domain-containing DNA-binding protein [Candidatus Heimdallarchaeaceae archaeon]